MLITGVKCRNTCSLSRSQQKLTSCPNLLFYSGYGCSLQLQRCCCCVKYILGLSVKTFCGLRAGRLQPLLSDRITAAGDWLRTAAGDGNAPATAIAPASSTATATTAPNTNANPSSTQRRRQTTNIYYLPSQRQGSNGMRADCNQTIPSPNIKVCTTGEPPYYSALHVSTRHHFPSAFSGPMNTASQTRQ